MKFRVLSIDGGGMRGIYSASYLSSLERSFARKRNLARGLDVGKAFHLIVGTSTGAIIGCALARGVRPDRIVGLYEKWGSSIFPRKMPSGTNLVDLIRQVFDRPKYLRRGDAALTSALTETLGSMTVGELWGQRKIALAIPAVNMANYRAWVFKTPHDPKSNHRDDNYSLVDVCRASSAAPLFRSLAAIDHPTNSSYDVFSDGGLWANNPVIVAVVEALRMSVNPDEEIEIYSLGSCGKPEGDLIPRHSVDRGLREWKFGGEAATLSIAAQEYAFDMVTAMLLPFLKKKVRLIRFPADKIPASLLQYLSLDETRPDGLRALMSQARNDADKTNSDIQQGLPNGVAIEELFNEMPEWQAI